MTAGVCVYTGRGKQRAEFCVNLVNTVSLNSAPSLALCTLSWRSAAGLPVGFAYEDRTLRGRLTFALNMPGPSEPCAHREPLPP